MARLTGVPPGSLITNLVHMVLRYAPLPDTFLKGIVYTLTLGQRGQIAFFHGQVSTNGVPGDVFFDNVSLRVAGSSVGFVEVGSVGAGTTALAASPPPSPP